MKKFLSAIFLLVLSNFTYAETTETITTTVAPPSAVTTPASTVTTVTTTTTEPVVKESDALIVSSVYDNYSRDAAMTGTSVTASAKDGIVELSGSVTMQSQADQAVLLAKRVAGVKDVRSSIIVKTNQPGAVPYKSPNY